MATKRLARQLGLIRRKSAAPAGGSLRRGGSGQSFDYLIVIDFESTCWSDGKGHRSQEIIEFPAVLLNTSTGETESEFHAYVQPQEHPILSEFCKELTGITQDQVDEGVPLNICLSQFRKWIQKIQQQKKISFAASGVSDASTSEVKSCAFVTWSDWDLGVCLEYECKRKQLLKPVFLNSWIDLRVTYKTFYGRKPEGLRGALQEVGIKFSGREHSGLDDSRNTALLAWKMIRDGCLMKITKSLNKVPLKKNPIILTRNRKTNQVEETSACNSGVQGPSTGDREPEDPSRYHEKVQTRSAGVNSTEAQQDELQSHVRVGLRNAVSSASPFSPPSCASGWHWRGPSLTAPLQGPVRSEHRALATKSKSSTIGSKLVLVSTTLASVHQVSDQEVSPALDCLPMLADWEEVALLPASQPEHRADPAPPVSGSDLATSPHAGEREMVLQEPELLGHENLAGSEEIPQKPETAGAVVYKSPHTTIYSVREAKDPGSRISNFKLPECRARGFDGVEATVSHPSALGTCSLLDGPKRMAPSSPAAFPAAKRQTFTIHKDKPASSHGSPLRSPSQTVLSYVLSSTVNLQGPWKSGKMTPPLCKCGRRAKRRAVSNNGPNHGKVFYCCPVGKFQENKKCCGYFKWEQTLQKERAESIAQSPSSRGLAFNSPSISHICDRNATVSTKNSLRLRPSMRN